MAGRFRILQGLVIAFQALAHAIRRTGRNARRALLMVIVVVVVSTVVAVMIPVPAMIVLHATAVALPVTCEEPFSIVVRPYPSGALIRRPRPISFMPPIVPSHWIPIAVNPDEFGAGAYWPNANHARGWRSSYTDAQRNLSMRYRYASKQNRYNEHCHCGDFHDSVRSPFKTTSSYAAQFAPPNKYLQISNYTQNPTIRLSEGHVFIHQAKTVFTLGANNDVRETTF
jgi:hypothetical protein